MLVSSCYTQHNQGFITSVKTSEMAINSIMEILKNHW